MHICFTRREALAAGFATAISTIFPSIARAEGKWQMGAPLPRAMGEVVGVNVGRSMYVFGGLDDAAGEVPIGAAYRFDEVSGEWSELQKMPQPAHHLMSTTHDGHIYLFGGFVLPPSPALAWQPTSAAWRYDPATDQWKKLAALPRPRGAGQAVTVGGKIYVIGGASSNTDGRTSAPIALGSYDHSVVGFVDEYDIGTDTWRPRATMPTPRNHYAAQAINGKIYAVNGRTGSVFVTNAGITDLVDAYDPGTDAWVNVSRAITNRGDVSAAIYNGRMYIAGGEYQNMAEKMALWEVESFDPATKAWNLMPHMNVARHGFAAAFIGNKFHVCGGSFQSDGMPGFFSPTATHEVFEVA